MLVSTRILLKILALFIVVSFLLPLVKVGNIGFKADLVFLLLALPLLIAEKTVNKIGLIRNLKIISYLLLLWMFISNNAGLYYFAPDKYSLDIPTEFVQIFSRISVFYLFVYIAIHQVINYKTFIRVVSSVFIIGLFWGILQSINIPFVNNISVEYYASTVGQGTGIGKTNFRVFGVSGNIITWGGLSVMMFYFFYYIKSNLAFKSIGLSMALINVLFSGSRSSLLALVVSFVIIQLFRVLILEKKYWKFLPKIIYAVLIIVATYFILSEVMPQRIEYIADRFLKAEEDLSDRGRGTQITLFMNILNTDKINYIFGIGKPAIDNIEYMEIEPIFILVAYGIVGLLLFYSIVLVYLKESYKLRFIDINIYLYLLVSLVAYLIFSLGFYFFKEPSSGLPFWWLSGYFFGYLIYLNSKIKNVNISNTKSSNEY